MSAHEFDAVEHFTVGAVGEPGRRVFVVQMVAAETTLTIKVEKQQVAALANYLGDLLDDLPRPGHLPDDLELRGPLDVAWIAGSIAVTYDEGLDRLVLVLEENSDDPEEEALGLSSSARVAITREQAAAVAIQGTSLVESGRPPCPLCGFPLDPTGHACPRTNGHRPPQL